MPKSKKSLKRTKRSRKLRRTRRNNGGTPTISSNEVCPICLGVFSVGNPFIKTSCRHKFHRACLNTLSKCPICRRHLYLDYKLADKNNLEIGKIYYYENRKKNEMTHETWPLRHYENNWATFSMGDITRDPVEIVELSNIDLYEKITDK